MIGGTALFAPGRACANGRFPASTAVFLAPSSPDRIVVRTTFGLVVSSDRGRTWDWICDGATRVASEDPMIVVSPTGTVLLGTGKGLTLARGDACRFGPADGTLGSFRVVDLAAWHGDPFSVVAIASQYLGNDDAGDFQFRTQLFESKDDARSFAALAAVIDPALLVETVDVAPSDPNRIYLSGQHDTETKVTGFLETSRDHGATFEPYAIDMLPGERSVYVAAVDPANADRVFLRTRADLGQGRLLLTDDAGKTVRTIFTGNGPLPAFALSADGARVFVGGPRDGIQVAKTTDFVFSARTSKAIECLALASDGIWACASEKEGFVVGFSTDDAATFEPRLHFCDIRGALACPAESSTGQCFWAPQKTALGCDPPEPDAGADAGMPDASLSDGDGGGCAVAGGPPTAALLASAAALVAFALRRRRTRQGAPASGSIRRR